MYQLCLTNNPYYKHVTTELFIQYRCKTQNPNQQKKPKPRIKRWQQKMKGTRIWKLKTKFNAKPTYKLIPKKKKKKWKQRQERTWAKSIMKCLNLGCKPASFLSRLAMGLQMVLRARVPNFTTGRIIFSVQLLRECYMKLDSCFVKLFGTWNWNWNWNWNDLRASVMESYGTEKLRSRKSRPLLCGSRSSLCLCFEKKRWN